MARIRIQRERFLIFPSSSLNPHFDLPKNPRARNDYNEETAYEPRARLPVQPRGLCRRRLDDTLPVRLVLKVTLFLLLHCTGGFHCFWGVLTRLDQTCLLVT